MYHRERLNTAVTRAKKKCVLLCAQAVLDPTLAVCETPERQEGFELLRSITMHCGAGLHGCCRLNCVRPASAEGVADGAVAAVLSPRPCLLERRGSSGLGSHVEGGVDDEEDQGGGIQIDDDGCDRQHPPPHRSSESSGADRSIDVCHGASGKRSLVELPNEEKTGKRSRPGGGTVDVLDE
mgnify:CR=1 FL=1